MESTEALPAGYRVFSKYVVVAKLAQGGMAEVYLAYRNYGEPDEELLVLKRIKPHLRENQQFVDMFKNEAKVAGVLKHQNVVQIYEIGHERGEWFMVMEYLDGRDMLQLGRACRQRKKAVPFEVTARLLSEACGALAHAHNLNDPQGKPLNLVHRDMSPENIFLTFDGDIKLLDFGIAKSKDSGELTQAGQVKGKLGYVSPEAIKGKTVDGRSDIYAVGATLYLFLTGRPAVKGNNPLEVFEQTLRPPIPPTELNPHIPKELETICMKAMAINPKERYQTALAMQKDLEVFLKSRTLKLERKQRQKFMAMLFPPEKDNMRAKVHELLKNFKVEHKANKNHFAEETNTSETDLSPDGPSGSLATSYDTSSLVSTEDPDAIDLLDPIPSVSGDDGPPTRPPSTDSIEMRVFQPVENQPAGFSLGGFAMGILSGAVLVLLGHFFLFGF
ncbi:MAG: hypothetical protein CMH56_13485 [Myxococcales bacterium]|nr:hypothetical protein [Myxococcales bacterium]|tara:strand:+ start:3433 stop:4767 length:1335 start_codon:yes stop_codon:yes gene_type:complete